MDTSTFNSNKIIERLTHFNYKYELNNQTIKVFLPMFCYLKINFKNDSVKMTSHLNIGIPILPLEYNFWVYGLSFYILGWYQLRNLNTAIFLLFGVFLIHLVICFIKIESLRIIIHNWMESDFQNEK